MNEHGGATRRKFLAGGGALALGGAGLLSPSMAGAASSALPVVAKGKTLYWITANLADPFYIDGIAGMKKFSPGSSASRRRSSGRRTRTSPRW